METTIKIFNAELSVSLYDATVIHTNKFSTASGGMFNFPVFSTLYTYVVFRSKQTGDDWAVYIKDYDPILYNNQEVAVISVRNTIVGYVDKKTDRYYYTTSDFSREIGIGINRRWIWTIGLLALISLFVTPVFMASYGFLSFFLLLIGYYIQKWVINYRTKKAIDHYMR